MKHAEIINKLSLEEKALLMSGKNTWETWSFDDKGIPSIFMADGPHGIRKQLGSADHLGLNESIQATSFPTAATLANSWDVTLVQTIGEALGKEAVELGVNVVLGPGMNIKRSPLGGRNFEYFSEDPVLTGKLASAMVKGIQSNGIAASPKHFAANSQELRRMSVDSIVDERTFREIYLQAFEMVVEESKPKFMMTAYNPINGVYANEHEHLLQNILFDEWGYEGAIVTDWGGSNNHVEGVRQGSHLEMPSTGQPGAREIIDAVKAGALEETLLDQRIDELLDVVLNIQIDDVTNDSLKEETIKLHHSIAYNAAKESIVLLKNEANTLPLIETDKVGLVGDFVKQPRYRGAGSSMVNPTQLDSIQNVQAEFGLEDVPYAKGYHRNGELDDELIREAITLAKSVDKVIVFMGLTEISESEGIDRTHLKLEQNQLDLIKALTKENKEVIVVLSGGSSVELPFADDVQAIVHTYLSGQAGSKATLDILTGQHNPSGKLNESYPISYDDVPNAKYFPGLERTAEYRDGLYVGYRYYETANQAVRYPFGHGLSYTTFEYQKVSADSKKVTVKVRNTGEIAGSEVVQIYVHKDSEFIFRPKKTLVGFEKVYLEPGEAKTIEIPFTKHAFEFYNTKINQWEIESGEYQIEVGSSSRDIRQKTFLHLDGVTPDTIYEDSAFKPYFSGQVQDIKLPSFEALLGHKVPKGHWDKEAPLTHNDSISQLYYAKSPVGRAVYNVLNKLIDRSIKKGKPNLDLYFNYNMTFRAIQKMTLGMVNTDMVDDILHIVNGSFFSGTGRLVRNYFRNRKMNKRGREDD